jgi:hypothetical protein
MARKEIDLFKIALDAHPDFLNTRSWVPGPPNLPPDIIITDTHDRKLGLELTEWLDRDQTKPSISNQENEARWLEVLNAEARPQSKNFDYLQIEFHEPTRYRAQDEPALPKEFRGLISYVDQNWEQEMMEPQRVWIDFTNYPTLQKHVSLILFQNLPREIEPVRWVLGTGKGGAYDARRMTGALLERIARKRNKTNYTNLKAQHELAEFVLFVHYGMKGLLHNTPVEGQNWKMRDVIVEARANLAKDHGPFDRVFLYLAYNEGELFHLYP